MPSFTFLAALTESFIAVLRKSRRMWTARFFEMAAPPFEKGSRLGSKSGPQFRPERTSLQNPEVCPYRPKEMTYPWESCFGGNRQSIELSSVLGEVERTRVPDGHSGTEIAITQRVSSPIFGYQARPGWDVRPEAE